MREKQCREAEEFAPIRKSPHSLTETGYKQQNGTECINVRFEVFTAVTMKNGVF
jgi:hypothetical protein